MTWAIWSVIGVAVIGAVLWFMLRRPPRVEAPPAEAPSPPAAPKSGPPPATKTTLPPERRRNFFGAAVRPGPNACDAAKALSGKRYLTHEAPVLPLAECDAPACRCQIIPLDDRRAKHDRRDSFSAYGDFREDPDTTWSERGPGRRKTD